MKILFIYALVFPWFAAAQKTTQISFQPHWKGSAIPTDSLINTDAEEWIQFSSIKWYCSSLKVSFSNGTQWQDTKAHRLIDFADSESSTIDITHPFDASITHIQFLLGVDSLTQAAGAMGHDLDPTNGMYWTWQSGYIHAKIEGTSGLSSHPKKEFALHLGGYRHPFNTLRQVTIPVHSPKNQLVIFMDMDSFINQCALASQHHIMSPSATACNLASHFASSFQLQQP